MAIYQKLRKSSPKVDDVKKKNFEKMNRRLEWPQSFPLQEFWEVKYRNLRTCVDLQTESTLSL